MSIKDVNGRSALAVAVRDFHEKFGHPIGDVNVPPTVEEIRFRLHLISEEFCELLTATLVGPDRYPQMVEDINAALHTVITKSIVKVDLPAAVDALADLDWVVEGTRCVLGVEQAPVLAELVRANMSKVPADESSPGYKNRKPQKPLDWRAPDIEGVLIEQGWKGRLPR